MVLEFGCGVLFECLVGEWLGVNLKELCEVVWFCLMDELLLIFECECIVLLVELYLEDWIEQLQLVIDIVMNFGLLLLKLLYIVLYMFYYGDDMVVMIVQVVLIFVYVCVVDMFDYCKSSQLCYIVNLFGLNQICVYQYFDIGQGEIDWDVFFCVFGVVGFDGVMLLCVFVWEDCVEVLLCYMCDVIQCYVDCYFDCIVC